VFVFCQKQAQIYKTFILEHIKLLDMLGLSGIAGNFFGIYFTPLLIIKVVEYISQISCKVGLLEHGIDMIVLGE
jgi:hypothetical protein